jgi:twitching motility protein PilT
VISQTLLKRKSGGRVAAHEVLIGVPAIANLIREGKTVSDTQHHATSRKNGMIMLNDALLDLVKRDVVAADEAYAKAVDKQGLLGDVQERRSQRPTRQARLRSSTKFIGISLDTREHPLYWGEIW